MVDTPKPTDEKQPAGNVSPAPSGGQPATPTPVAQPKPGEPTPGAQPGATPTPQAQPKEVPITALHEERTKRQEEHSRAEQLEQELAELRRVVQQTQMQQQAVQPQAAQPNAQEELNQLWEEDPRKAVKVEIMYAMDWRDRIDSSLEVQADQLARQYPDFNQYRSTALGQVRSLPLNQRGAAGILEAAYFMVRGQNADSIIQQRENELLEKYRRGEISAAGLATPPGSFSTPAPTGGTPATDEQIRVAEAMGMSIEDYMSAQQVPK